MSADAGGPPIPVRDDVHDPDPGFAQLYSQLPDATDLEPWLRLCRAAEGEVLYVGVGTGRLALPLAGGGVSIVGVDSHPGMLARLRQRAPEMELHQSPIENLQLGRRFSLVMAPACIIDTADRLAGAARHTSGALALEILNPHWLAAGAGGGVRVERMDRDAALIRVPYEGGYEQVAEPFLIWPEAVEPWLRGAGLTLVSLRGMGDGDLAESPSYLVTAAPSPLWRRRDRALVAG